MCKVLFLVLQKIKQKAVGYSLIPEILESKTKYKQNFALEPVWAEHLGRFLFACFHLDKSPCLLFCSLTFQVPLVSQPLSTHTPVFFKPSVRNQDYIHVHIQV